MLAITASFRAPLQWTQAMQLVNRSNTHVHSANAIERPSPACQETRCNRCNLRAAVRPSCRRTPQPCPTVCYLAAGHPTGWGHAKDELDP